MPNRLASAQSPYLQQHADNPVDWYEWGAEAFDAARERGVPILLSIGYAPATGVLFEWLETAVPGSSAGVQL